MSTTSTLAETRRLEYEAAITDQHEWAGLTQYLRLHGPAEDWHRAAGEFWDAMWRAHIAYVRWQTAKQNGSTLKEEKR